MNERPDWRDRLRSAVDRSGKKQAAVAWDAGITPETLSRILNAPQIDPHLGTVVGIAQACGVTVGWLLDERGRVLTDEQRRRLRTAVAIINEVTA